MMLQPLYMRIGGAKFTSEPTTGGLSPPRASPKHEKCQRPDEPGLSPFHGFELEEQSVASQETTAKRSSGLKVKRSN